MRRIATLLTLVILCFHSTTGQISVERSVQVTATFEENLGFIRLHWLPGINATGYEVSIRNGTTWNLLQSLSADDTTYLYTGYTPGDIVELRVEKQGGRPGFGYIETGFEVAPTIHRGKFLMVIEKGLADLPSLEDMFQSLEGDGWIVDSIHVDQADSTQNVRSRIQDWYNGEDQVEHAVWLLGHVPVPYAGQIGPDGHGDHVGAWPADVYYAEMNGRWSDETVNNTSARDSRNHNIPGDGKWDNSQVASDAELHIGRVDLSNLPAFNEDERTLTENYLLKNIAFRNREFDVKRRGLIENNFAGFDEGFGQNGWKNFAPMFGPDSVRSGNYEVDLVEKDYLWAYACGGGSYTSMGGVGNTTNLYVDKDIQAVFVMNFGSYFGDWDRQNNLLRAALGSGYILTNAWAARPNWQFHSMALGDHIGSCAQRSQNNLFTYASGFGARSIHVALLGDPTLRLHPMKPVYIDTVITTPTSALLSWSPNEDVDETGYIVLRKNGETGIYEELPGSPTQNTYYLDEGLVSDTSYTYSVRPVRLETSASGSYYNTGIGYPTTVRLVSGLPEGVEFAIDSASCFDADDGQIIAQLEGGVGPFSYAWSHGDMDSVAQSLVPGSYFLDITSGLGATGSYGPIDVFAPDSMIADITTTPSSGNDGTASAVVSGGTPPYRFQWGETGMDPNNLPPGIFDLIVTDGNGCEQRFPFEIKMATSTEEQIEMDFIMAPVPCSDVLDLNWSSSLSIASIQVVDMNGKLMMSQSVNKATNHSFNLTNFPSGSYILKIILDEVVVEKVFIIAR